MNTAEIRENQKRKMNLTTEEYFVPTRDDVRSLKVGDLALDCFGKRRRVTRIHSRPNAVDINGKAYVCFYTELTPGRSECSHSYKEGELVRHCGITRLHKSVELDLIEQQMKGRV